MKRLLTLANDMLFEIMLVGFLSAHFGFAVGGVVVERCCGSAAQCNGFSNLAVVLAGCVGAVAMIGAFILPGAALGFLNTWLRRQPDYAELRLLKLRIWAGINAALVVAIIFLARSFIASSATLLP